MEEIYLSKFLRFRQIQKPDLYVKTYKYEVSNSANESDIIGYIAWFNRWRRYTFQTVIPVILDKVCMQQIIKMIDDLEEDRKR